MISPESASTLQQLSKELDALVNRFLQNGLTPLEHELLKQKCVELYDAILRIQPKTIQHTQPLAETPPTPPPVREELSSEPEPTLFTASITLLNDIPIITTEDTTTDISSVHPDAPVDKTETELKNEIIDEIIEQKQVEEAAQPVPLLKEVINELSLHEKIASVLPPKADLAEKLSTQISSLKTAINVNLKIAMVNELFNESSVEYVKAIDKLNTSENIHEAMRYFSELKHTYSWDSDNSLVKELEGLISKRYSS